MADDLESIGGLSLTISGDYSQLMSDLQTSQGLAADAGSGISQALAEGAAGAETLTESTGALQTTLASTEESATGAAASITRTGSAAKTAGAEAAESEGAFAALTERFGELALELTAGLTLLEFGKQMFEAAGAIQQAQISLTALTGSAEGAAETIDRLKTMAIDQGLSFPTLLQATQRMTALGFAAGVIPEALQAAADAAAATNTDIGQLSDTMDRLALSGQVSSRFLATLGISTHELAEAMGVADDAVLSTFHSLDTTTRLHVLTLAIEDIKNFQGLSQQTAESIPRQWQSLKSTFEDFTATLGDDFSFLAGQLITFFKNLIDDATLLINAITTFGEVVEFEFTRAKDRVEEWLTVMTHGAGAAADLAKQHQGELATMVAGFTEAEARRLHLNQGVEATAKTLAQLQAEFNQDLKTKNWDDANQVIAEMGKISVPAAEEAMKRLVAASQNVDAVLTAGLVRGVKQATGELAFWIEEEKLEIAQDQAAIKGIAEYGRQQEALGNILNYTAAQHGYFAEQAEKAADKISKELEKAPDATKALHELGLGAQHAGEAQKNFEGIMSTIGESVDKALPPLSAIDEAMLKIDKELASGALSKIPPLIRQLASEDLPKAVAAQDRYVDALNAQGATWDKVNAAVKEQVSLHEQLALAQGKSLTGYQVQLGLVDLQTKNLGFDTDHVLGTTAVNAINSMDKALSALGPQFAKLIVQGGSFGQIMHQIFNTIAEDILSAVINAVVKMGEQFLVEKILERTTTSATNVAAVTSEAAVAAANSFAATAAIPIIGPALAPAAAAEAEAFVLALAPQAAFETGGYVPETMLALVHQGEYVVPAKDVQAAGGGQGALAPGGISINIGQLHGVTRETADHVAKLIIRQARLAGAFH